MPLRPSTPATAAAGLAALAALLSLPANAAAQQPIEGVWNYNGGAVLVEPTGPGTFRGVVTRPTQFSSCTHKAGEDMWRLQGSGERYTGTHNYFKDASSCEAGGFSPGKSAWRVDQSDPAAPKLVFCSNPPADPRQPGFDAEGRPVDHTPEDCEVMTRLAPPGPPPSVAQVATLPSTRTCRSRRSFRIRFKAPGADPVQETRVYVNGRRVKVVRGPERLTAGIDLRGLPRGRYAVRIRMVTASGKVVSGTRRYRTCAPRRRG